MTHNLARADLLANSLKALAMPGHTQPRLRTWSGEIH